MLADILRNEGKELPFDFQSSLSKSERGGGDNTSPIRVNKDELIAMILNDYVLPSQSGPGDVDSPRNHSSIGKSNHRNNNESVISAEESALKNLFTHYCQFGEPMNTKLLKSIKLIRLLRECGLV